MPQTIRRTRILPRAHQRSHKKSTPSSSLEDRGQKPVPHEPIRERITPKIKLLTYRGVNASTESFFATIRRELIDRYYWDNPETLRIHLFNWIETWYNQKRKHTAIRMRTPNQAHADHQHRHTA